MSFEIEWIDARGYSDPNVEPKMIRVEGNPSNWIKCWSKGFFDCRWLPEPLTSEISEQADEKWASRFRWKQNVTARDQTLGSLKTEVMPLQNTS